MKVEDEVTKLFLWVSEVIKCGTDIFFVEKFQFERKVFALDTHMPEILVVFFVI